jgi:hypothetical protein
MSNVITIMDLDNFPFFLCHRIPPGYANSVRDWALTS